MSFKNSSYIAVRNLSLDGLSKLGDGVKAEAGSTYNHHITVERLDIKNFNNTVQTVGVNTKSSAWNWVIRYNTITSTGTGMYLGGSSGQYEFVNSLIEHNLIYGTLGYNIEIKHQLTRNTSLGIPSTATTIMRHNMFSKANGSLTGAEARPNLLVGHWPLSGAGSTDIYQIYGNVFYENPYEALFQGEGNIAFHDNLMVNRAGTAAIHIQKHNNVPKRIDIWNNTVVGRQHRHPDHRRRPRLPAAGDRQRGLRRHAALRRPADRQHHRHLRGGRHLPQQPDGTARRGPRPLPEDRQAPGHGARPDLSTGFVDQNSDFNGLPRLLTFRGAYSGEGVNPGWLPAQAIKP